MSDQPRVPAGNPAGGQWTNSGRGQSSSSGSDTARLRDRVDALPLGKVEAHHTGDPSDVLRNPIRFHEYADSNQRWEMKLAAAAARGSGSNQFVVEKLDPNRLISRQPEVFRPRMYELREEALIQVIRTTFGDVILDGNHRAAQALLLGRPVSARVYESKEYRARENSRQLAAEALRLLQTN